jgi:hypothetical protein
MGKTLKRVDPLGRETRYIYGSNNIPDDQSCLDNPNTLCNGTGIDLLEVRQINSGSPQGYDVLATYTYTYAVTTARQFPSICVLLSTRRQTNAP